jgi:hypothetical protein
MGLLKLVDNVPGIDFYEFRDQDYYNKYTYRARLTIIGVRHLLFVSNADELTKRAESGFSYYSKEDRQLVKDNLPILSKLLEWKLQAKKDKKSTIRGEHNTLAVFSNDLAYLHTLKLIDPELLVDFTEVQRSEYEGVKYFVKEPKHKFRVYLKSKRVEENFPIEFKNLLDRNAELHPSPGLYAWLKLQNNWKWRWASAGYFIDYDDESTLSYLALMHGEMLGKKYKLEKRPEAT